MPSPTLPFDTTDCRRHFRRYLAEQTRARQQRMRHTQLVTATRRAKPRPVPPVVAPGTPLLNATAAMHWLQLRPKPFYYWRNALGIVPIVKGNHQALYLREDLLRIHIAYLVHRQRQEMSRDGD